MVALTDAGKNGPIHSLAQRQGLIVESSEASCGQDAYVQRVRQGQQQAL